MRSTVVEPNELLPKNQLNTNADMVENFNDNIEHDHIYINIYIYINCCKEIKVRPKRNPG